MGSCSVFLSRLASNCAPPYLCLLSFGTCLVVDFLIKYLFFRQFRCTCSCEKRIFLGFCPSFRPLGWGNRSEAATWQPPGVSVLASFTHLIHIAQGHLYYSCMRIHLFSLVFTCTVPEATTTSETTCFTCPGTHTKLPSLRESIDRV
jgi:hypothetical protein